MHRGQANGLHADAALARPMGQAAFLLFDEDHRMPRRNLGGGDADRFEQPGAQVAANAAPGNRFEDEAFEWTRVEQPVQTIRTLSFSQLPSDPSHAEQSTGNLKHVSSREAKYLVDPHPIPDLLQQIAASALAVCRRRQEGGVNGADRSPAHHVKIDRLPEAIGQFLEQVVEHAGFVGAPGAAARQNDCALDLRRLSLSSQVEV